MNSPYKEIFSQVSSELERAVKECGYEADVQSTISISKGFGDMSSTCALKIAKRNLSTPLKSPSR
jgi:arginyl-tRNA synthetase